MQFELCNVKTIKKSKINYKIQFFNFLHYVPLETQLFR